MTDETQTSMSDLLSFMNDNMVEIYGNVEVASRIMPTLTSCMKEAVQRASNSLQNCTPPFEDTTSDDTFGMFLSTCYGDFLFFATLRLRDISPTFQTAWRAHYNKWIQENAEQLQKNPEVLCSAANMNLPNHEDAEEIKNAAIDEISHTLFEWYRTSLVDLVSKEKK